MRKLLAAGLLALTGCATLGPPDVPSLLMYKQMVQCVTPGALENFVYRGFDTVEVQDTNLVLSSPTQTVVYSMPAGSACRIKEIDKEINFER